MNERTIGSARPVRRALAGTLAMLLLLAAGCGVLGKTAEESAVDNAVAPVAPEVSGGGEPGAPSYDARDGATTSGSTGDIATGVAAEDRLVIRTKTLRLEVEDVNGSIDRIRTIAASRSATITNMQVASASQGYVYYYDEKTQTGGDALSGYVTVRVPAAEYEALIADVAKLGTVLAQSESSDDVTQEHVDLAARLENLRAEELRLREFFDAAKDVKDMLAIEQELSRVRGEIESLDAQVKYLERQAAMATVTIELTEPTPIVDPGGDDWGFKDAVTAGIRGAAAVLRVIIVVGIAIAPYAAIALALAFLIRTLVRRRRNRRDASTEALGTPVSDPNATDETPVATDTGETAE